MARFQQKLLIPSSPRQAIRRAALFDEIETSTQTRRVTVIAAPAGWGKTTTIAQWAHETQAQVAWYTLDSSDHDPRLFLDYLLHSIVGIVPTIEPHIHQLELCPNHELAALFRQVALTIAAANRPFTLILDDFHTLATPEPPPETHDDLSLILSLIASISEYANNCHLIIASRTMPLFHGMVRLLAQQRATVLDYGMLRFQPADVQALASISRIGMIGDHQAKTLCEQLGGWVCGIVLSLDQSNSAAMAMAISPHQHVEARTHTIYAFLADQVINPLPRDLQQFLEDTSVLDDLSAQHCDTLRQANDSARYLDEITQRGLFVTVRGEWISYHSLFRDFLRSRLAKSPMRERPLLLRAAQIFAQADSLDRAIELYLACGDSVRAYLLMRSSIRRYRQISRQRVLLACFDQLSAARPGELLPADLLIAQARICAELALWERAFTTLHLAETIGTDEIILEAHIMACDLHAMLGDANQAQKVLASITTTQMSERLRFLYQIAAGRVYALIGNTHAAIQALEQAHTIITSSTEAADDPGEVASMYDFLGWAYAVNGERTTALRYLRRADACWQAIGNNGRRTMTLNNLGMIALEEGRLPEAKVAFETGLLLARQIDRIRETSVLYCSLADYCILVDDLAAALDHYSVAYRISLTNDIQSSVAVAAAGALWVCTLQQANLPAWLTAALTTTEHMPADAQQRIQLAYATRGLLNTPPERNSQLASIPDTPALNQLERVALALFKASLQLEQAGWGAVAQLWQHGMALAASLPMAPLRQLLNYHQPLVAAAAQQKQLRSDLLGLIQTPIRRPRWQIQALGTFNCLRDGKNCELSPIHRALLIRLLDAGPSGISYEALWESVWGDLLVSRSALDSALSRLRTITELNISTKSGICAIRNAWEDLTYDVQQIEQLLSQSLAPSDLPNIIDLYQGQFFPGAPLSATIWVEARRAQLQQQTLNTLDRLAQQLEHTAPAEAITCYQHILRIDGCREHTAMQLMRLADQHGNRRLVVDTFEQLREALRSLNVAPQASTTAFYRNLI